MSSYSIVNPFMSGYDDIQATNIRLTINFNLNEY